MGEEVDLPKKKKSNILSVFIKIVVVIGIIVGAVYIYLSFSDDNNQELNCGDPNQDGSNRIYVCSPGKTLKLPPNDNLCVGDTCTDSDCCVDIPSVDSSSVRICQTPSSSILNNYNMTNVQENDLHMDSFDVTGISCNDGYSGIAEATVCTRPGGHYTVSGCTSSTGGTPTGECIRPLDTTGYDNIRETNLSRGTDFAVSADCATPDYTGRAIATPCTSSSEYTLQGCLPVTTKTCGNINGDSSMENFNCNGETNDIASNPSIIQCTGDACNATECCTETRTTCATGENVPNIFTSLFSADSPSLRNQQGNPALLRNISASDQVSNNPCAGTPIGRECQLDVPPCPRESIGGTITCQTDGTWNVVNCTPVRCDEPNVNGQNMSIPATSATSSQCIITAPGETCQHQCDYGYEGGSVTCVRDGDTARWNIEACAPIAEQSVAIQAPDQTEDDHSANFTWKFGQSGDSCNTVCQSDGKTCSVGIWQVNNMEMFTGAMSEANVNITDFCTDAQNKTPSEITPYYSAADQSCYYSDTTATTHTCGVSPRDDERRLCRCTA